jgi:hypothetical protein
VIAGLTVSRRDEVLAEVLAHWAVGELYEAHERLEDLAELVEDDDRDHDTALALVHVAACLHKLANDVGKAAVPAKLTRALGVLRAADPRWLELDLAALVAELEDLARSFTADGLSRTFEVGALPKLRRG